VKGRSVPGARAFSNILTSTMEKAAKKSSSSKSHARPAPASKRSRLSKADELTALREQEELRLRTAAEFDRYRKPVAKERRAATKSGVWELVQEILLVQDGFDRAFQSEALRSDLETYQAVRSIQRQVHQILEKQGIMSFESVGQAFDPTLHEAVDAEPSHRFSDGTVSRELRKGYVWGGKVLRPARVILAKNQPPGRTLQRIAPK
jgi:molecular chaperone GrpE